MEKVRLTPAATADLDRIARGFFEPWQLEQALAYTDELRAAFHRAADQPMLSPMSSRERPDLRTGRYEAHRFLYRIEAEGIAILRVYHHRQDMRVVR